MANVKNNLSAQETKRKLISAAGEVFADVGLERATIKAITDRAGTSLAAVNYHFKDKYELYHHVIREVLDDADKDFAPLSMLPESMPPSERLRFFIDLFMRHLLTADRPEWHCTLMGREIQSQTDSALGLMTSRIQSVQAWMERLIASMLTRPYPPRALTLFADSVMGQCTYYLHEEAFICALNPGLPPVVDRLDEIIDHITRFTLAAVTEINRAGAKPAKKPPAARRTRATAKRGAHAGRSVDR